MKIIAKYLIKITKFIHRVIVNAYRNDLLGLSAEIAFFGVFSLFPIMISLIALLSMFARDPNFYIEITSSIYRSMPQEVAGFLNYNLKILASSSLSTSALLISMLITLWTSSNVIMSFIKGINRAYGVEESRSYIALRRLSLSLIFSIGFLLFTAFMLIVYGETFTIWFLNAKNIVLPTNIAYRVFFLRWSFIVIILFLLSSLLYYRSPNTVQQIHQVIPGAIFFSTTWIISTTLFGLYLESIANYSATYGTLGITIVLLLWLYITDSIFLIGAEINASLFPHTKTTIRQFIDYIKSQLDKLAV